MNALVPDSGVHRWSVRGNPIADGRSMVFDDMIFWADDGDLPRMDESYPMT